MNFKSKLGVLVVIASVAASCGGSGNPYYPGGPWGPGASASCGGAIPRSFDPEDIDGDFTIIKEPDWLSGGVYGPYSPVIMTQGRLSLHTRKIPGSYSDVSIFGCLYIDPRAFFSNFFYADPFGFGSMGPVIGNEVPIGFSSTPAQVGRLTSPYADWQTKVIEGYALTGPVPLVGSGPGFPQYGYPGIPQQQNLILQFTSAPYPGVSPTFIGSMLTREGSFEIYYGSGVGSYQFGGYPYGASTALQRTLWTIVQ